MPSTGYAYNTRTSWSCALSTQLAMAGDLICRREVGQLAPSSVILRYCTSLASTLPWCCSGWCPYRSRPLGTPWRHSSASPVVAWWRRIAAEDLSAGLGWFVGRQSQGARTGRLFRLAVIQCQFICLSASTSSSNKLFTLSLRLVLMSLTPLTRLTLV